MATAASSDRGALSAALRSWQHELVGTGNTGGRNPLLNFRHLKAGSLNLGPDSSADQLIVDDLLAGETMRLSDCFPEDNGVDASRRARRIHNEAREHEEEQGIRTLYLGRGFATWERQGTGARPNAPVLLAAAELNPQGRVGDDFTLGISDDWEFNPVLLQRLKDDFSIVLEESKQEDLLGAEIPAATAIFEELAAHYATVPGFAIKDGLVLRTFSYANQPLVRDLEAAESAVARHPLVAAITNDVDAAKLRSSLLNGEGHRVSPTGDALSPQDEYLVLDADSTQSDVIQAAIDGANLVVLGPPGTGKSQTIANLLATLTARGKSILFVAEKRAAIDAVLRRLKVVGLGDLVLDLHEGMRSRRQTAEQLAKSLETARNTLAPDNVDLFHKLAHNRARLRDADNELHLPRPPWDISLYELQERLLGLDESDDTELRLPPSLLEALSGDVYKEAKGELRDYIDSDGHRLDVESNLTWGLVHQRSRITSAEELQQVRERFDELRGEWLPMLERQLAEIADQLAIERPATMSQARSLLFWLEHNARSRLGRLWASLSDSSYRRELQLARALVVAEQGSSPKPADSSLDHRQVLITWHRCRDALDDLSRYTSLVGYTNFGSIRDLLSVLLQKERPRLNSMPRLHELRKNLRSRLGDSRYDLLTTLARDKGWSGDDAVQALERIWTRSVFNQVQDEVQMTAPTFDGAERHQVVADFRDADQEHIERAPDRVIRAWAEAAVASEDAHPDQAQLIRREAGKSRRHLSTRSLFDKAPDVLTALKPCWAMSPLLVPQILPLGDRPPFDVVVFDEASQIRPADAISSLLRGSHAIVAGDPQQLPPTSFFVGASDDLDDDEEEVDAPATQDMESILDAIQTLLPLTCVRTLGWHYRSRDERLIAFANHHIYERSLTTFPGIVGEDCIEHIEVPFIPEQNSVSGSYSPEVERVVELVLQHAERRPAESLGVIALGMKHAERISDQLRMVRRDRPDLDAFFGETKHEPFFIKNLERVQGDERDAIILSVGYGRTEDGRMRYNFGPINQENGYRRLNVAVTRAKRRMTIVSCFSANDMDPDRLNSRGPRMLRDYIAYAASGGSDLGSANVEAPPMNSFELDIQHRLEARGLKLSPQYGASGYWIDFAVMHPDKPGRPVLAIEADGAQYHSRPATRDRDRLRQEHLERLGWRFHRIWSTDWFNDREGEADRAVAAYEQAVQAADAMPESSQATKVSTISVDQPVEREPISEPPPSPPKARRDNVPKPHIRPGTPITEYSHDELVALVRWIESDGRLRSQDELIAECVNALGFKRRGSRIVERLQAAIEAARTSGQSTSEPSTPSRRAYLQRTTWK